MNPVVRVTAAVVLVVWTTALAGCSAHCFLGTSHLGLAQERQSCHAAPSPCHGGSPDDDGQPDSDTLCATLKHMSVLQQACVAPQPSFFVLYFFAFDEAVSGESRGDISQIRHGFRAERRPTPEVYLGVALHSLAPPSLS
ncbi:MAG: hypothetical protein L0Y58_15955 [Verrucomicrobia subdivision 3 bacterium]|nr:hypothetical protein [Limisphaerales bacterium]